MSLLGKGWDGHQAFPGPLSLFDAEVGSLTEL